MFLEDGIAEPLADGSWINSTVARIIDIIREHYPDLDVMWIPRDKRSSDDAAFAIIERRDGRDYVAFYVQEEKDFDERVLERVIRMDMQNKDPHAHLLETEVRAHAMKLARQKQIEEASQDRTERYLHRLTSGKNYYRDQGHVYHM